MTSSWALTKRKEMKDVWAISNFGDDDNALGGWEDHYIVNGAQRECGPNFEAVPIGNPYGFMICRRKKRKDGRGMDVPPVMIDPSEYNGYHKFSPDLYRPWRKTAIQITNPDNYYDRTTPNEAFLHQRDYLAREIKYNGTGVDPIHTPGPRRYNEYGYSYTNGAPYKFDVTRLHQPYPIWKTDKIYHGMPQEKADEIDTNYNQSVTMSTW